MESKFMTVKERHLKIGEMFDPMRGLLVLDGEGNDVSASVKLVAHNVNTDKAGIYTAVYSVNGESLASRVLVDCCPQKRENENLSSLAMRVAGRHFKLSGLLSQDLNAEKRSEAAKLLNLEAQLSDDLKNLLSDAMA